MQSLRCKVTKKISESRIFLLFFVSLHKKIAFIMKKYWIIPVFALLLAACQESLEDRCAREAEEYTRKNCPAKMDNNTTLDSMTFDRSSHTLHYYYTLTGFADQDSIVQKIDAVNVLKNEVRNSTGLKLYKDHQYRFAYTFRSEKDPEKILIDVVFTDKDY